MVLKRVFPMILAASVLISASGCSKLIQNKAISSENVSQNKTVNSQEQVIEVSGQRYPLKVRDYLKVETVIEKKPERVAVLAGTQLNIWYQLGGKSICTSNLTDNVKLIPEFRDEMKNLPTVGVVHTPDLEKIVELKPDLIISQAGSQAEEAQKLRDMGYKVITTYLKGYDDVISTYTAFGKILGEAEKADQFVSNMNKKKAELVSKLPAQNKSVVILYATSKSVAAKLDNSIAGDVAKILNIKNIASGSKPDSTGSETTPLDIEYIASQNPDYILVTSMISSNEAAKKTMDEQFAKNPAWKAVKAVNEGRVVYLPQEYFLYNAGSFYTEAIEYMARAVYPERFGKLDGWYGK